MLIFTLLLVYVAAVPVFSSYLTADLNHIYKMNQRRLLMRDIFMSIKGRREITIRSYIEQVFRNAASLIHLCDTRRVSTLGQTFALIQQNQNKRLTYCASIFHLFTYYRDTQHNTLTIQIMQGFTIHFNFITFHFEWRKLTYSGVSISGDIFNMGRRTTYFTGVRQPWIMIITNNTAQITISNFAYLRFRLNMFYIACKAQWFTMMGYENSSIVPHIVNVNLFPSFRNPHEDHIKFSYHFLQIDYKQIIFSVKSIAKSNVNVVIFDGPGFRSRRLLNTDYVDSYTRNPIVTTTFSASVVISTKTSDVVQTLMVSFRPLGRHMYRRCTNSEAEVGKRTWVLAESSYNTICTMPMGVINLDCQMFAIYRYQYTGPLIFTDGDRAPNCQYGGIYHIPNIGLHQPICEFVVNLQFLKSKSSNYLLIVWLSGYSEGYIEAEVFSCAPGCTLTHLDSNALIYNQTTVVDDIEHCRTYIWPAPLSPQHKKYNLNIKIPGRPVGTVFLSVFSIKTEDKCVPGFGSIGESFINISGLYYNSSQLGRLKTFSIHEPFNYFFEYRGAFEYLIRAEISVPLICETDNSFLKPFFKFTMAICHVKPGIDAEMTMLAIGKIVGMTKACENSVINYASNIYIYYEDYNKNYSGHRIDVDYHSDNCPERCKNYTYTLKVYHRYKNRVYVYSANVGDYMFTGINHQGLWLKINAPNTPCPLSECAVWIHVREVMPPERLASTRPSVRYRSHNIR